MTLLQRLGLAIVRPHAALAIAGERRHAGRAGSDLMVAMLVFLVATDLRFLVEAVWAGVAEDPGLGLRLLLATLTGALTLPLGFLVVASAVMWSSAGERRDLGRSFDLGCVAMIPFLAVDLAGRSVAFAFHLPVPRIAVVILTGVAFAWSGIIIALAMVRAKATVPPPDAGRRAGWALAGFAALGLVGQSVYLAQHPESVRPMRTGDPAPLFALPLVGPDGALGTPVALDGLRHRVVVLDFWATWCAPCLASMPRLDAYARAHPEITVLAINTDDPREARAIFTAKQYALQLLEDNDGITGRAYHVETIPHTVVIDGEGTIRAVLHSGAHDLASVVQKIQK